jgi:hypothetical protein
VELSGRARDQGCGMVDYWRVARERDTAVCRSSVALDPDWEGRSSPSSVLAPSVPLSPKLRVAIAQTEHMPFYLRVFFRLLSSWVHHVKSQVSGPFRAADLGLRAAVHGTGPALAPREPWAQHDSRYRTISTVGVSGFSGLDAQADGDSRTDGGIEVLARCDVADFIFVSADRADSMRT